jgi:hypothetical protein
MSSKVLGRNLDANGVLGALSSLPEGDDFVLINGAALAMRGLRHAHDVDILVSQRMWNALLDRRWPMSRWSSPAGTVRSLLDTRVGMVAYRDITVPGFPLTYEMAERTADRVMGVQCISTSLLGQWKRAYGRATDIADLDLIDRYINA